MAMPNNISLTALDPNMYAQPSMSNSLPSYSQTYRPLVNHLFVTSFIFVVNSTYHPLTVLSTVDRQSHHQPRTPRSTPASAAGARRLAGRTPSGALPPPPRSSTGSAEAPAATRSCCSGRCSPGWEELAEATRWCSEGVQAGSSSSPACWCGARRRRRLRPRLEGALYLRG